MNLLSGKSSRAIRNADGKVIQAAEFQSREITPGRVQPDRRWFGNTRTISQNALEHFRESLNEKIADPYAVVLKQNKLPMSLLTDAVRGVRSVLLLSLSTASKLIFSSPSSPPSSSTSLTLLSMPRRPRPPT